MNVDVPDLMLVRALGAAEPFAIDETISIAFTNASIGRLVRHDLTPVPAVPQASARLVPDALCARVLTAAGPYRVGDVLTISFVDPRFARIHGIALASSPTAHELVEAAAPPLETTPVPAPEPVASIEPLDPLRNVPSGVRVRLNWTPERAKRFTRVVDKLFTVDRLGWYRHVLAMRLLIPDDISCGDEAATREAMQRLDALHAATIETLGKPLLAAYMPAFTVTHEWLDAIESAALVRSLAGLRDAVLPFGDDTSRIEHHELRDAACLSNIRLAELRGPATASADALLAVLIGTQCRDVGLSEALGAYRSVLIDVFVQTAGSVEEVRIGRMSEPNVVLDDRLRKLAAAVEASFATLAPA